MENYWYEEDMSDSTRESVESDICLDKENYSIDHDSSYKRRKLIDQFDTLCIGEPSEMQM